MADERTYDHVELVVWSGTGNSRHVAERVAAMVRSRGASARIRGVGERGGPSGSDRRLLGLIGPTHGFTATWPMLKESLRHPGVRGRDVFVLATRGGWRVARRPLPGWEGSATYLLAAVLAVRGARVRGVAAVDMPLNWTVVFPSLAPDGVAAVVARGLSQTDRFAGRMLDGARSFRGWWHLPLGLAFLPISIAYLLVGRLVLAKSFLADERCISCGRCERECPHDAVHLRGPGKRPYWTYDCQSCMRCMSDCPTEAIQGAQAWLLFYTWLTALPVGSVALGELLGLAGAGAGRIGGVGGLLADYAWIIVSVWVAYAVLWLGLAAPGIGFLLSRSTLTGRYRRYRGPVGGSD